MAQNISLPPEVRSGSKMHPGKGWRLVTPNKRRAFKVALLTTFRAKGQRLAIFRIY